MLGREGEFTLRKFAVASVSRDQPAPQPKVRVLGEGVAVVDHAAFGLADDARRGGGELDPQDALCGPRDQVRRTGSREVAFMLE